MIMQDDDKQAMMLLAKDLKNIVRDLESWSSARKLKYDDLFERHLNRVFGVADTLESLAR